MFWRRKEKRVETMVKDLQKRLDKIEQILDASADKNLEYTVNIDHLHAHQPVLEELTFRLDQLDIKTVSGALNLGNNFGVRVVQDEKKQKESENKGMDDTSENLFNINPTASGYSFRRSSP